MTKREALEQCIILWTYIVEHPEEMECECACGRTTNIYQKLQLAEQLLGYWSDTGCPACEYAERQHQPGIPFCDACPVQGWNRDNPCFEAEYNQWSDAISTDNRNAAAEAILARVKMSLEALDNE